jgi:hypothetical protein
MPIAVHPSQVMDHCPASRRRIPVWSPPGCRRGAPLEPALSPPPRGRTAGKCGVRG